MDPKLLAQIGLTEGEAKVYLALLRLGEAKTLAITKEASVSYSKVYQILDRLIKKGLVGHITKQKTKHYVPVEPKRITEYIDKKEEELKNQRELLKTFIPHLEQEKALGKHANAVVYEGFKAVTNFLRGMLDELTKGSTYHVIGGTYAEVPGLFAYFHKHHIYRHKKGINVKLLANHDVRGNVALPTKRTGEIRYLPSYLLSNLTIYFYKNKAFLVVWSKSPTGILLENEEAVKGFQTYFDTFWKMAEP